MDPEFLRRGGARVSHGSFFESHRLRVVMSEKREAGIVNLKWQSLQCSGIWGGWVGPAYSSSGDCSSLRRGSFVPLNRASLDPFNFNKPPLGKERRRCLL